MKYFMEMKEIVKRFVYLRVEHGKMELVNVLKEHILLLMGGATNYKKLPNS